MRSRHLILIFLLFSCSSTLAARNKVWVEIRSPHFRLLTDGDETEARHVLLNFELMRTVFESQFPHFKLDTPAPLTIFAAKDEGTMKLLLPQAWAHPGPKPGGLFEHAWEREYALVRLDVVNSDPYAFHSIYHEYVHSVLHANFHWLPSWLDEGLAEFYGYTKFDKEQM